MSKVKNPLLSLGAKGSLADTLTYTRRRGLDIIEKKPVLPYFLTLPAQYQRWLYQDYAHLWRQQSPATQQSYQSSGSRYHLTGFQYWMKYQLTNLPDILGMWHLDEKTGAIVRDSSRNENHGTIFGALPIDGAIGGAYSLDGIDDEILFGNNSTLDLGTDDFTIELLLYPTALPAGAYVFGRLEGAVIYWRITAGPTAMSIDIRRAPLRDELPCVGLTMSNFNWYHLLFTGDRDGNLSGYFNGDFVNSIPMSNWGYITFNAQLNLGKPHATTFWKFSADNLIIYHRLLDETTIKRHSERRYPS